MSSTEERRRFCFVFSFVRLRNDPTNVPKNATVAPARNTSDVKRKTAIYIYYVASNPRARGNEKTSDTRRSKRSSVHPKKGKKNSRVRRTRHCPSRPFVDYSPVRHLHSRDLPRPTAAATRVTVANSSGFVGKRARAVNNHYGRDSFRSTCGEKFFHPPKNTRLYTTTDTARGTTFGAKSETKR